MYKHISFPSIEQFRNIVVTIKREAEFIGLDETGEAIYDETRPKPVLKFQGTVKLHGTNMGVCYFCEKTGDPRFFKSNLWAQSRESIITPTEDNAGAAFFVLTKDESFSSLFKQIIDKYNIDSFKNTISIYGEWVGKGIQKGVGINNLEKSMFIFAVKITPHPKDVDDKTPAYWVDSSFLRNPENRIFNIQDYQKYEVDIDFNNPQEALDKISEMVIAVEDECPVSKAFGFSGIGEGIVFAHMTPDGKTYRFKAKGEKHSKASKVKELKPVDDEKVNRIIELVNKITPNWRLEQALDKTFNLLNGGGIDVKKLGEFIKNVLADIVKEESDVIAAAGFEPKEINSKISEKCRNYFFAKQDEEVGLKQ